MIALLAKYCIRIGLEQKSMLEEEKHHIPRKVFLNHESKTYVSEY